MDSVCESVVETLEAAGYMGSTIRMYKKYFRQLASASDDGIYTGELGRSWSSQTSKPGGGQYSAGVVVFRKRVAHMADTLVESGAADISMQRNAPLQPMPESESLLGTLTSYARHVEERGPAEGTRDYYWRLARECALFLESSGVESDDDAGPASVLGFLSDILSRWTGTDGRHVITNFRPFLKFLGRRDLVDALKMAGTVRRHGIVRTIPDRDEDAVAEACCNRLVTARDAAITLLALTTGMRACDIVGLKMGDVDWRSMTIRTTQKKTGNPLVVPMVPAVAAAIAEYILEERPVAECGNVFVRTVAPHVAFRDHSAIYEATRRTFSAAGVEGCAGTLLLRHNAASKMLRAGVRLPVISAVLGHADPDSTGRYMEADDERMRSCVLPLPKAVRS